MSKLACLQVLAAHCEAWISKFQGLLHTLAQRQLGNLHEILIEQQAGGAQAAAIAVSRGSKAKYGQVWQHGLKLCRVR